MPEKESESQESPHYYFINALFNCSTQGLHHFKNSRNWTIFKSCKKLLLQKVGSPIFVILKLTALQGFKTENTVGRLNTAGQNSLWGNTNFYVARGNSNTKLLQSSVWSTTKCVSDIKQNQQLEGVYIGRFGFSCGWELHNSKSPVLSKT